MKTSHYIAKTTIPAVATISQGQPVGYDGDVAGDAEVIAGVAMHDAVSGDALAVCFVGVVVVTAGGVIAKGAEVEIASGKFVTVSAGKVVGHAMDASTGDGDKIRVKLVA